MAGNSGRGTSSRPALTYYDGFYYYVDGDGKTTSWFVFDSTGRTLVQQGYVIDTEPGAINAARAWIDSQNSGDIGDAEDDPFIPELPDIPDFVPPTTPTPGVPSPLIAYKGYFYSTVLGYVGMWSYTVYDNLRNAIYSDTINPAAFGAQNTQAGATALAKQYIDSLTGSADPPPEFVPVPGPSPVEPPPTTDPVVDPPTDPPQDFEIHTMYDCETGDEYVAYTQEDHERYAALGYVHDMSECKMPEDSDEAFALFGLIAILAVAYVLYEAFKGESPSGD